MNLAVQTLSIGVATLANLDVYNIGTTARFLRMVNTVNKLLNCGNPHGKGCHIPLKLENENYWRPILTEARQYFEHLKISRAVSSFN